MTPNVLRAEASAVAESVLKVVPWVNVFKVVVLNATL
jgi:hypothetical protein